MSHAALFAMLLQQATTPVPADSTARLSSDTTRLVPVVVTTPKPHRYGTGVSASALRTPASLIETPLSVTVVTQAAIREQSMLSIGDALRYVPGITMGQGEGHRDAPTIRGNSSTADFFVDGARDDAQYLRDLYNVERIEALAGANAMSFGRGSGGGVVNRVTKRATFEPVREVTLEGGAWQHGRGTVDVGGALGSRLAGRLNALYQSSESFRDAYENTRLGIAPQATVTVGRGTALRMGAEYFRDERTVDRGVPSIGSSPSEPPRSRFFGLPDSSYAEARVVSADALLERAGAGRTDFRALLRYTDYDKFYQNVFPGSAVSDTGTVNLAAYNNEMKRRNLFSQNELVLRLPSARFAQTILVGAELGRQSTDNLRHTGYFNGTATSETVPFDRPRGTMPVEFRQSASDPDNTVTADVISLYAQDQIWLTRSLQATLGVRLERFDLSLRDHRAAETRERRDDMIAPRAGLLFRPIDRLSLYGSYSVSNLPASGDQFSSLTTTTRNLEPERFINREVGLKWNVRPTLFLTLAAYQLDRTNSAAPSALDPGVYVQTGKQRTDGVEVAINGRIVRGWDVMAAFTAQEAEIESRTTAAPAGATVPLVPHRTASLWNRVQLHRAFAVGVGTHYQSDMFAAIDNAVTLPSFWRVDGALYLTAFSRTTVQLNVENLFDESYYATSHGNNNIMPGAPRTVRLSLTTRLP